MRKILILGVLSATFILTGCNTQRQEDEDKYSGGEFSKHIRTTEARTPEEERLGFKLPDGFEIELFASEPDIQKPMNITFDAKGRMWVTQSSEYPYPAAPGQGKDRITILEDTDHDGKADRFTDFTDTLSIPIGILPLNDGAIAYSIPNINRFADADSDGKADDYKKLYGPFQYNDTHGMVNNLVRGYDGWVHACHGYNVSTVAGADGDSIHMVYGNTFRFRTDGSRVEQTTYGRINPFGLAYDERGYLYSTDCHTSPLYQLIHGGDYSQWGKVPDIGFAPEMKPLEDEATALAGMAYYADVNFPEKYRSNFYIGDVVACRVYRNSASYQGSSPIGKKEADFVLSEDPWFRPVDIKLGPDGALYIADFYNSIIGHYEVPLDHPKRDKFRGRIWRITYKGKKNKPTDLTTASVESLVESLDKDNMPIRMAAADQLADRIGSAAVEPVKALLNQKEISARQYIHGLWVLQRLNSLSHNIIERSAAHSDPLVRIHTMRVLKEISDDIKIYYPIISNALEDKDPHVQRAAVELLQKYSDVTALESALSARHNIPDDDTHLLYTARLCLRNLLRNEQLFQQVIAKEWKQEDAAYLADVMVGVRSPESAAFMLDYISQYSLPKNNLLTAFQHIARFIPYEQLGDAINISMEKKGNDVDSEFEIFKGLQQGIAQRGAKENIQLVEWGQRLAESLLNKYPAGNPLKKSQSIISRQHFAVDLAGKYKVNTLESKIRAFVQDTTNLDIKDPDWDTFLKIRAILDLKTAAFTSLLKLSPEMHAELAISILQNKKMTSDFKKRVATVLGDFPGPSTTQVLASVDDVPSDLQATIVMSLASSSEGKSMIFKKVRKGEIFARTLIEPKVEERIMLGISPKQQKEFEELTANLEPVSKEKQALIYTMLTAYNASSKKPLSVSAGKNVFAQHCSTCHKIGDEGGTIGPNLDGVGEWGPQALAEKILDPNRNISEAFRNYTIKLKDGKVMTGLYRREEGELFIFADVMGKEFSVPKNTIAERKASKYTLMPDHFGKVLSQEDFNALLTYLTDQKN